jgi:hypothetical protein
VAGLVGDQLRGDVERLRTQVDVDAAAALVEHQLDLETTGEPLEIVRVAQDVAIERGEERAGFAHELLGFAERSCPRAGPTQQHEPGQAVVQIHRRGHRRGALGAVGAEAGNRVSSRRARGVPAVLRAERQV